jgi:hypothetical protein
MQLKYTQIVSTALFLAMAIAVAFTQSAYAAAPNANTGAVRVGVLHLSTVPNSSRSYSIPKGKHVIPLDTQQCFNVSMNVAVTGTNTISVYGLASFFCGLTDNGGLSVSASILCPGGVAPGPTKTFKSFPSGIRQNPAWSYLSNFTGFCEHCVIHVPTAFPFFTITTSVYAYSYVAQAGQPVNDPASYGTLVEGSGGPAITGLVNSASYRIPC